MNNEPIQFLPVEKFWERREETAKNSSRAFCLGLAIGLALAWMIFAIFFDDSL